jgi:hypothetical protein
MLELGLFLQDIMSVAAAELRLRSLRLAVSLPGGHNSSSDITAVDHEHTEVAFATFLLTLFSAINLLLGIHIDYRACAMFMLSAI